MLKEAMFFEMKAYAGGFAAGRRTGDKNVTLSTEDYQTAGVIDILANNKDAKKAGVPAILVFITTADTGISPAVLRKAAASRVAIWQAVMFENPTATKSGGDNLKVGHPILLNPEVYLEPGTAVRGPLFGLGMTAPIAPPYPSSRATKLP